MSDPHESSAISVTIKGDEPGGKFNDPKSPGTWIVFHGSPTRVREQIIEVFALSEVPAETPLFELVNQATSLFKAAANVKSTLGGTVLNAGPQAGSQPSSPPASGSGDVWDQAAAARTGTAPPAEEKKEDADPILVALELAKSVADVQQIWAENQAAFNSNPAYMDAYRARGKALS